MNPELKAYLDAWYSRRQHEFDALLRAMQGTAAGGVTGPVTASSDTVELVTASPGLADPPATAPIIEESLVVTPAVPIDTMAVVPASCSTDCPAHTTSATNGGVSTELIPVLAAASASGGTLDGELIKGVAPTELTLGNDDGKHDASLAVAPVLNSEFGVPVMLSSASTTEAGVVLPAASVCIPWASTKPWLQPIPPRPPDPWSLFPGAWSRSRPEAGITVQWQYKEYIAPVSNIWMFSDFQCVQPATVIFDASLGLERQSTGIPRQDLVLGSVLKIFRSGAAPSLLIADSMESANSKQDGILGAYDCHVFKQKQKCMARELPVTVVSADFQLKIAGLSTCPAPVIKLQKLSCDCIASIGVHFTRTTVCHTILCAEGNKFRNLSCSQSGAIFKHQGASHVEHTTLSRCQGSTVRTRIHSKAVIPCLNVMMVMNILLYAWEYVRSGNCSSDNMPIGNTTPQSASGTRGSEMNGVAFIPSFLYVKDLARYMCRTYALAPTIQIIIEAWFTHVLPMGMDMGLEKLKDNAELNQWQLRNVVSECFPSNIYVAALPNLKRLSRTSKVGHQGMIALFFWVLTTLDGESNQHGNISWDPGGCMLALCSSEQRWATPLHCYEQFQWSSLRIAYAFRIGLVAWIMDGLEFSMCRRQAHFQGGRNVLPVDFADQVHVSRDCYIAFLNQIPAGYDYYLDPVYYIYTICSDLINYHEEYHDGTNKIREVYAPWDPGKSVFRYPLKTSAWGQAEFQGGRDVRILSLCT